MDTPPPYLQYATAIQLFWLGVECGTWYIPLGDEVVNCGLALPQAPAFEVIVHAGRIVENHQGI